MSDVSKITLPDSSEYDLKDAAARSDISQLTLYKNSLTAIQRLILPNVFEERKANNSTGYYSMTTPGIASSNGAVFSSGSQYYTTTLKTGGIGLTGPALIVLDSPEYRWFGWVYDSTNRTSTSALRKLTVEGATGYGNGELPLFYSFETGDVQVTLSFLRRDEADMTTDADDPTSDVYILQRALHVYKLDSARIPIVSWNSTTGVLSLS